MFKRIPLLLAGIALGAATALGASAQEDAEAELEASRAQALEQQAEVLAQAREEQERYRQEQARVREELARAREEQAKAREELARAREEQAKAREEAQGRMEEARRELEEAARQVAELSGGPGAYVQALRMAPFRARTVLGVVVEDGDGGAHVTGVTPGGAAAGGGVAVGDVITAIDTVTLTGEGSQRRLVEHMSSVEPGEDVVLHVQRDGDARQITVAPTERDASFFFVGQPGNRVIVDGGRGIAVGSSDATTWVGPNSIRLQRFFGGRWNELELVALTEGLGNYFGTSEGLLVVRAPEDDTIGLQDGDVILEIGGRTPTSPEHAMRILMSFENGETLRLSIMRRQRRENVEYVIPGNNSEG